MVCAAVGLYLWATVHLGAQHGIDKQVSLRLSIDLCAWES